MPLERIQMKLFSFRLNVVEIAYNDPSFETKRERQFSENHNIWLAAIRRFQSLPNFNII